MKPGVMLHFDSIFERFTSDLLDLLVMDLGNP